jgi:hypothetical protein
MLCTNLCAAGCGLWLRSRWGRSGWGSSRQIGSRGAWHVGLRVARILLLRVLRVLARIRLLCKMSGDYIRINKIHAGKGA